jgi:hypothetical protein
MLCQDVSGLVDFERDGLRGLGRSQDAIAIRFAVHLEPDGETNHDCFPGDVTAAAFFQLCRVIARFDDGAGFEPVFEGLFLGRDLF